MCPKQPHKNGGVQNGDNNRKANKAVVLKAFDALFSKRDYKAA
jgi:hypothetical protein